MLCHAPRPQVDAADVVVIEGILVLAMQEVRELMHMKIYVDTDDDVRLARRIQRDVAHRGRDVAGELGRDTVPGAGGAGGGAG